MARKAVEGEFNFESNIDLLEKDLRRCAKCKEVKNIEEFYLDNRKYGDGPASRRKYYCRECSYIMAQNSYMKKNYGITFEQYNEMLKAQNNLCAICELEETRVALGTVARLSVDHCHETGKVRGLLCQACNNGLGRFRDQSDILRKAADYIERKGDRNR